MYVYNTKQKKQHRRQLRASLTDAERKVWQIIKNKQIQGSRFLRQYSVGLYILDFYCPKLRLAIEIDGGQHNFRENKDRDRRRTDYLAKKNIKVIRFWNNEVPENLNGVYLKILDEFNRLE